MTLARFGTRSSPLAAWTAGACALALLATACDGKRGHKGDPGPPGDDGGNVTNTDLEPDEDPPGIVIEILGVDGASGSDGTFQVGDTVTVRYTLKKLDGTDWDISELSSGRALFSGPTFNYQRVLAEQNDLVTASTTEDDGSHAYTFAATIPATYLAPLNDTDSFGADQGELAGEDLLAGTYTLGVYFTWSYTVEGESFRDAANVTTNVLFGGADTLQAREVVKIENCNQCHTSLRAHGGMRRDVTLCLLCHTAGAEDRNVAEAADGTPGVSVDFRVMIHKIHNGEHLPSVLGVATNADGSRNYAADPKPYEIVGFNNTVIDFSEVAFPVWPSLNFPMPRDAGYTALGSDEQTLENTIRAGVVACDTCHGDPDGDGPLTAPEQGSNATMQPSRLVCGSCHDDVDFELPYESNMQIMPSQSGDSECTQCHGVSGSDLDVIDAHTHPMLDADVNPGLVLTNVEVSEAGSNDADGTFDPGEKVQVSFEMEDDAGNTVDFTGLTSIAAVLSGPTSNLNLLLNVSIPVAAISGSGPYTVNLPEPFILDYVGDATAGADTWNTARAPLWSGTTPATTLYERTATAGGSTFLLDTMRVASNYIDVDDPTGFDRNDFIVIDDGEPGSEEYLQVQWVDGNRIWFSSPYQTGSENGSSVYKYSTTVEHLANATVDEVTLTTKTNGVDYSVDTDTGEITELVAFGNGNAVVVTYTTDFIVPATYAGSLNDSPTLDESWGEWAGKSLVDGTYRLGLWGSRTVSLPLYGETTSYRVTSPAGRADLLVGDAAEVESYDKISSIDNCYKCHQDIYFHGGGRRGFDACIQCHGTSGSEDRPRYRAANAPDTEGTAIQFRQMLHKIHMGADLPDADTYEVVGFGSGYPNNYSTASYGEVEFPALPGGVLQCTSCHGADNDDWTSPGSLDHPTEQDSPARPWRSACGSCHSSPAAQAHIEAQTPPGFAESCEVCHGEDRDLSVEVVHKGR